MTTKQFMDSYWPLVAVAGAGLVAWGTTVAALNRLKEDVAASQSDHDLIVEMRTDQKHIRDDITEIKDTLRASRQGNP